MKRPKLNTADRFLWACVFLLWNGWRSALINVKPETVIGWQRKGFRLFWTWKSRRGRPGRPTISKETRKLIRQMSRNNPLWGAPRIHGELLKLGIDIGETSVSKYLVRRCKPPSQTWRTFLEAHKAMVSVDFFPVPTIRFQVLYVFLVLAHDRRRIPHVAVNAHPTAEWSAPSNFGRHFRVTARLVSNFSYGAIARPHATVNRYVYDRVRYFLRRRHTTTHARGTRQFSDYVVFERLGIYSLRPH